MNFIFKRQVAPLIFLLLFVTSCVSTKKYYFYQNGLENRSSIDSTVSIKAYIHKISPNDILTIFVSSLSPEASTYFNPPINRDNMPDAATYKALSGYLVDANGDISLPFVGKLNVKGLTIPEARDTIKKQLERYLINPTVFINLENFKIILLGEVSKPGVYLVSNEQINLSEALAMAGDMTVYGKRKDILIVRETDKGNPEYGVVDITSPDVFKSPYYYLHPNDIIYINARKTKITTGDLFFKIVPVAVSVATLVSLLIIRFKII
jgi:polysaccharide export outer membrane protein